MTTEPPNLQALHPRMSAFCDCTINTRDNSVVDREETCPRHSWYRVCMPCGHGHPEDVPCPDHTWRDACPYYGLKCAGPAGGDGHGGTPS